MISNCLGNIDVVILAGGLGTRVSSVLRDTPKILAPVGGRPYLVFLLSWLKRFGARRIIFGLGHLAGAIEEHLGNNPIDGLDFDVVIEQKPLGTGGAIGLLRSKIRTCPVLVMNGDSFVDADLCEFVAFHRQNKTEVSILCTEVADAGRYGVVKLVKNKVIEFQEKKRDAGAGIINAGIYLFNPNILDEIAICGPSLERNFLQVQPAGRLAAMNTTGTFLDIGTPEDLVKASDLLKQLKFDDGR